MGKIVVRKVEEPKIEMRHVKELEEVTMKVVDEDFKAYTNIIKILKPEPTDNPAKIGKFEMVFDEKAKKTYIISKEPLTLREVYKLAKRLYGEYYFEDELIVTDRILDTIINEADKVIYYNKNRIQVIEGDLNSEYTAIRIQVVDKDGGFLKVKVRGYVKGQYLSILASIIDNSKSVPWVIVELLEKALTTGKGYELIPRRFLNVIPQIGEARIKIKMTDNINVGEIKRYIENARRIRERGVNVVFTTCIRDHNFYAEACVEDTVSLILGVGHTYARLAGYKRKVVEFDINDPRISEILAKIEEELKKEGKDEEVNLIVRNIPIPNGGNAFPG